MDEETRRFLDGLLLRHVEITQELITQLGEMQRAMREGFAALQAEIADQREQIQASTERIRAQTEALFQMLDRLPPRPQDG